MLNGNRARFSFMTKMLTREIRKMSRHFLVGRFSHGTSLVATSLVATSLVAISAKRKLPFGLIRDEPAASLSRETEM
jgi:hypothetical protein